MKITKISKRGLDIIKYYEKFYSKPYLCPAGVPTIGYGTTRYPNGVKVTLKDTPITEQQATEYLSYDVAASEKYVDAYTRDDINQNQFDALVSLCYNIGPGNLKISTVLKRVNNNPSDLTIRDAFMMWIKADGKKMKGLVARRQSESDLYFS